ncbi:hypothetical protein TW95_gp0264 [Pandoravirus inopinatum]|uniref:DUF2283 domain-containing protein n=1 Tax=Pandoravirus inopinatum TaxID=1605721 RepID=A0A0B5IWC4_9VIRU|nr:hypothetical protein TW95_gp0264 [Pandoravirus inopinatum]AJF96998.1 hypothetical protein [Pandoravirus inopinatum]
MTLRYSPDVDAIVIDLTPAEYVTNETVALDAPSDAFLDVDNVGKAIRIEFLDASSVFACHFHDHPDDVDGCGYVFLVVLGACFSFLFSCFSKPAITLRLLKVFVAWLLHLGQVVV